MPGFLPLHEVHVVVDAHVPGMAQGRHRAGGLGGLKYSAAGHCRVPASQLSTCCAIQRTPQIPRTKMPEAPIAESDPVRLVSGLIYSGVWRTSGRGSVGNGPAPSQAYESRGSRGRGHLPGVALGWRA